MPATLKDMAQALGDRKIAIVREITKIHEEVIHTTLLKAAEEYADGHLKGEIVLIIEGAPEEEEIPSTLEEAVEFARNQLEKGVSASEAAKLAAKATGFKKGEIYKALID